MADLFIGIDTSCYTSSIACVDMNGIVRDERTMLSVADGERGLRQSDGVFQHVRNIEPLAGKALGGLTGYDMRAVGVSARPRPAEASYMPVFLAGVSAAASMAAALSVPLIKTTHQQGHLRAALHGNDSLMDKRFIGIHLSGGTSEVLDVRPGLTIELLGGTGDLSAGQLVDRIGVRLGFGFPAGKALEALAIEAGSAGDIKLSAGVRDMECSFSGAETEADRLIKAGAPQGAIAYAAFDCIARVLTKLILRAGELTGIDTVLLTGGVASSGLLKNMLIKRLEKRNKNIEPYFAQTALAGDNAVGTALIARDAFLSKAEATHG